MIKSDDKVSFDGETKEEFSEFEYLRAKVNEMENVLVAHTDILRSNSLVEKTENIAPYIDEDAVLEALAGN